MYQNWYTENIYILLNVNKPRTLVDKCLKTHMAVCELLGGESSKLSGGGKYVETAGLNLLLRPLYSAENPIMRHQTQSVPSMTPLRNEQSK